MKYIKTLHFLAQIAAVFMAILVAGKLVCVLCAAVDPPLTALLAWMCDNAIVFAVIAVVGFTVWIFGDICDAQARKERGKCHARK